MNKHIFGFTNKPLGSYFSIPIFRFIMVILMILLSGILTFLALELYAFINPGKTVPLAFKGMYAWGTAINFGLSHYLVDICAALFTGPWGKYKHRTVGKTIAIWFFGYMIFFVIQRTLVWEASIFYFPYFNESYIIRPGHMDSFLFCFPFWLIIIFICLLTMVKIIHLVGRKEVEYIVLGNKTITAEKEEQKEQKSDSIFISSGKERYKIETGRISHISSEDHYLKIYVKEDREVKSIFIKKSLKSIREKLPENDFLQVHRSHIVNRSWIQSLERNKNSYTLILSDGLSTRVPVSRHRIPDLKPHLSRFM